MQKNTRLISLVAAAVAALLFGACSGGTSSLPSGAQPSSQTRPDAGTTSRSTTASALDTVLSASPASLTFTNLNTTQTFTVTSTGKYATIYGAASSNRSVATVTPIGSGSGLNEFTVTSVGIGSATITVVDKMRNTVDVTVVVRPVPAGTVYVSSAFSNAIVSFAPDANGDATPYKVLTSSSISSAWDVALDQSDNLYVANRGSDSVAVFPPNAGANAVPIATIAGSNTGISAPQGITVDSAGYVYVSNGGNNSVTVFAPNANGNISPVRTIQGSNTNLYDPFGIAVDQNGNVFVSSYAWNGSGAVVKFASGSDGNAVPLNIIDGIYQPQGVAVDNAGDVFVSVRDSTMEFRAVAANAYDSGTQVTSGGQSIGIDHAGNLHVPGGLYNNVIDTFSGSPWQLSGQISGPDTQLNGPMGIAIAL